MEVLTSDSNHSLQDYIWVFMQLFSGREDTFAEQTEKGEYRPKHHPLREIDVKDHLFKTVSTAGIYVLHYDDTISLAVIDIDIDTEKLIEAETVDGTAGKQRLFDLCKEEAKKQYDLLKSLNIPSVIEFSGKRGYHVWMFFEKPIPASYMLELKNKLVIECRQEITKDWRPDDRYEFFPKQAHVIGKKLGNLIKLPLGKHRVSKGYSYFLDPSTMQKLDHQFDFLFEIYDHYRLSIAHIEQIVGKPLVYPEVVVNEKVSRKSSHHLNTKFEFEIPPYELIKSRVDEMYAIIKDASYDKIAKKFKGNIIKTPPCIWFAYSAAKEHEKGVGKFDARMLLVRFYANHPNHYDPGEIACFFQKYVNDPDDNVHEERLRYYVAYAYGSVEDHFRLNNCKSLQQQGYCVNFEYKPKEERELEDFLKFKDQLDYYDRNIMFQHQREREDQFNKDIGLEDKEAIDLSNVVYELKHENNELRNTLKKQRDLQHINYNIQCERIWNPLSDNNEFDDINKDSDADINANLEDRMYEHKEYKTKAELDELHSSTSTSTSTSEPNSNPSNISTTQNSTNDSELSNSFFDSNQATVGNLNDIEFANSAEDKKEIHESQVFVASEYKEINDKTKETFEKILSDQDPIINQIEKTTRAGVTTSLTKTAKMFGVRTLLLVPTNAIGLDTFRKTVSISAEELNDPIYGAVFGSNINMCLKIYQRVEEELPKKHGCGIRELAIKKDLPFIFKNTCIKEKKDGTTEYCPFFNCIHVGYPTDEKEKITPLVKSQLMQKKTSSWCLLHHHPVQKTEICAHKLGIICKKCQYYRKEHMYIDPNSVPICAYATIYQHIMGNKITIRVSPTSYMDLEDFENNKTQNIVTIPRSKIKKLIEDGFIDPQTRYEDNHNTTHNNGLLDENENIRDTVYTIRDVILKQYDTLTLTYTKVLALYQSIENMQKMGQSNSNCENIVDQLKHSFQGIICDEVSHLVAQSPLQCEMYAQLKYINPLGIMDETMIEKNFFTNIDAELQNIARIINSKHYDYFSALRDYFFRHFKDIRYWVFNPSNIMDLVEGECGEKTIEEIMIDIKSNLIPQGIKTKISSLQSTGFLLDKDIRTEVRYIDVFKCRTEMIKIIKICKYYQDRKLNPITEERLLLYSDQLSQSEKITTQNEFDTYQQRYKTLMDEITIKPNEIGIVNEILYKFRDGISTDPADPFDEFVGYLPQTFIMIGWGKVNKKILESCFVDYEGKELDELDEIFLKMYNILTSVAIDKNLGFPTLVNMLLISNVESFFINSFSATDYKNKIVFQSIPSFDNIINLVTSIVKNKKKTGSLKSNFAIVTDATMPLIEMSSVFQLPTRIWKYGDPKKTCIKQLLIGDWRNTPITELYNKPTNPITIRKHTTTTSENEDMEDLFLAEIEGISYKKEVVSNYSKFNNMNRYHVIESDQTGNPTRYVDLSKQLLRFRLMVFINILAEKYPDNLFIISPNRTFDLFLSSVMKKTPVGIPIDIHFIQWLQTYYPRDWDLYIQKHWIQQNKDDSNYCFYLTQIEKGINGDKQYFRGNRTVGTECKYRVMLVVSSPTSPINAYDWLAYFYYEKNFLINKRSRVGGFDLEQLSRALRRTELQSTFFQTISRVKDPKGQTPSIVFTWGIGMSNFNWSKCELCGRNELEIYNSDPKTAYDKSLDIYTDQLYQCVYQSRDGKQMIEQELCHDCIIKRHAKVLGIGKSVIDNFSKDPVGLQDHMAFKIPIPQIVSINAKPIVRENIYGHFLDTEYQMLTEAEYFTTTNTILQPTLLRIKQHLLTNTMAQIVEKYSVLGDFDSVIRSLSDQEKVDLKLDLKELIISENKKTIGYKDLIKKMKSIDSTSLNMQLIENRYLTLIDFTELITRMKYHKVY